MWLWTQASFNHSTRDLGNINIDPTEVTMTYKTIKRRRQRKKTVFVKIRRRRWLDSIREEAFQEWKDRWNRQEILNVWN